MEVIMKKLLPIVIVSLIFAGCATTGMSPDIRSEIPRNATTIELLTEQVADELFDEVFYFLRQEGFRFDEIYRDMRSLSTEEAVVGKSGSSLRIDIDIREYNDGSVLVANGEWFAQDASGGRWQPVVFSHSNTKYTVGFEELVLLIMKIPHEELRYVVDEHRAERGTQIRIN